MTPENRHRLYAELRRDEGVRRFPYRDASGQLSIGVGWNLSSRGLPDVVIVELLRLAVVDAETDVASLFPTFDTLTPARQRVLINMAYNLGRGGLRTFKRLRAAVAAGRYADAADEMLASAWARQVGARATRLAQMMREG